MTQYKHKTLYTNRMHAYDVLHAPNTENIHMQVVREDENLCDSSKSSAIYLLFE
jgi:hypothetical protein